MIAPLPLSTKTASAATFPTTTGTYIIEKITWSCACFVDSTKPPALSSFDVKVDGVPNPVTAFSVFGSAVIDLTLTTTVYSGSVITLTYNAPAIDNTLANDAFQRTNGEDYASFTLTIDNLGGSRPEPNTPVAPTVVAGEESATITVTAPTSGRTPTSYEVTASPGGAKCTVDGASGSCTITGLTAGTAYTFTTIAKRTTYSSAASAPSASTTVLAKSAPNTPGTPTVVAGEESATITVTAPTGLPVPTSYEATATPGGAKCTVTGASGSCTISGLTAGTAYTFTTVAKVSTGDSSASTASASTTVLAKTKPNTPGVPTVVAGEESATITVTAPTGGLTPTSYEVTASPGDAKCTVTGASGSCTISGLTAGTAYTFTTVAKVSTGDSSASTASASVTALTKTVTTTTTTTTLPAGYTPSWDKEPLTESETDANTVGIFPAVSPGLIIITDEMGFTLDKKNGIRPKIRMKSYAGKIKMTISSSYKVGAKTKKYKCTFAPFGTAKKIKTIKWRWYTPKKACVLPAPLVAAVRANKATLSASGKWSRQWLTTAKKARPNKSNIKARTLKYTMKAKPAAVK